jgi:hypothetical protein
MHCYFNKSIPGRSSSSIALLILSEMKIWLTAFLVLPATVLAQGSFAPVSLNDLRFTYDKDTAAHAVVLEEFGRAFFDNSPRTSVIFQYHVRMKIMDKEGLRKGNFSLGLRRNENSAERLTSVRASSFNLNGTDIVETRLDDKEVFTEDKTKYSRQVKFAVPNVHPGSVMDVTWEIESPYVSDFRTWEFQSDIPKLKSDFHALIPANYVYSIVLRGSLSLSTEKSSAEKDCYRPGGGRKADCALLMYGMVNIPAFRNEQFMTARANFLSAVYFELSEVRYFDGKVKKYTSEWSDVNTTLLNELNFGQQIKKNKDILQKEIRTLTAGMAPLERAKAIHRRIANHFVWDKIYGIYCENGIQKASETRKGNVADINLSLVAALQGAGFDANPVILATREKGVPIDIHPVLSDFNYVVVEVTIDANSYLLDATENVFPFGLLPVRCLNGRGRRIGKMPDWVELKPIDKRKKVVILDLAVDDRGKFVGKASLTHQGYDGAIKRYELTTGDRNKYIAGITNEWRLASLENYDVRDLEDMDQPLTEVMDVSWDGSDGPGADKLYLNPFLIEKWKKNPFIYSERSFPVDFGAPLDIMLVVNLSYPEGYELTEIPSNVALTLPAGGGKYLFSVTRLGNKVSLLNQLLLNKTVYSPGEYRALYDLFGRFIQMQESVIVFTKKK